MADEEQVNEVQEKLDELAGTSSAIVIAVTMQ